MITKSFIQLLQDHPGKKLGFEYGNGALLRQDYHITEVKNVTIQATDCGGRQAFWEETIIQLWENPVRKENTPQMRTKKAHQILSRVYGLQPMKEESQIKFEYGNSNFHTSQMKVEGYRVQEHELVVVLAPEHTTCKAQDVCIPSESLTQTAEPCAPGSGCC